MTENPQNLENKPRDLGELLLSDKTGVELRTIVNELTEYNGLIKAEINSPTGLLELTAKQQQMQQALMASANLQKSHSDMVADLLRKLGS